MVTLISSLSTEVPNDVSVVLGQGDGTFQPQPRVAAGDTPQALAVADVNGDGHPDVVLATNEIVSANFRIFPAPSNGVWVLLGQGDGTFQLPQRVLARPLPQAVAVADVNSDGHPDLLIVNIQMMLYVYHFGSNDVEVLLGQGDGIFQPPQRFATGDGPRSVAVADVNSDGHPDLLIANSGSSDVSVLLGQGDGTFQPQLRVAAGTYPPLWRWRMSMAIAAPISSLPTPAPAMSRCYWTGAIGPFNHASPPGLCPPLWRWRMSMAIATPISSLLINTPTMCRWCWARAMALSSPSNVLPPGTCPPLWRWRMSMAMGTPISSLRIANRAMSRCCWARVMAPSSSSHVSPLPGKRLQTVAVADVNGDGHPDLLMTSRGSSYVSVFLGNGNGTFQSQQRFAAGDRPQAVVVADVNSDGRPDLVTTNAGSNDVSVLLGQGNGTFQPQLRVAPGSGPTPRPWRM